MSSKQPLDSYYPVIKCISEHLAPEDLPNFRRASKTCKTASQEHFFRNFFTTLTVFTSRVSLTMLVEICSNAAFAANIQRINYASKLLIMKGLSWEGERVSAVEEPDLAAANTPSEDGEDDEDDEDGKDREDHEDDEGSDAERFVCSYTSFHNEQQAMYKSGEALDLFYLALKHLKTHGVSVVLGLVDLVDRKDLEGGAVLGGMEIVTATESNCWETTRTDTLDLILTASLRSNYNFRGLAICVEMGDAEDDAELETHHGGRISIKATMLDKLHELLEDVSEFRYHKDLTWTEYEIRTQASSQHLLSQMVNLKTLHVRMGLDSSSAEDDERNTNEWDCQRAITDFVGAVSSTSLREIHLEECMIHCNDLTTLLEAQSETVRVVELKEVGMLMICSWTELFTWILNADLKLERLSLDNLYLQLFSDDEEYSTERVIGSRVLTADNMVPGLKELVSKLTLMRF